MKPGYVPIERRFRSVSDGPIDPQVARWFEGRPPQGKRWGDLIDPTKPVSQWVVLMAPSGSGKTTEVLAHAERLRAEGLFAFCVDAGALATGGFSASLHANERELLDRWHATSAPAVIFLDAADEVGLRHCRFRDACRQLGRDIDFGTRTVKVVVTTRNGSWSEDHSHAMREHLARGTDAPTIDIVTFDRLGRDEIKALARARGTQDLDAFMFNFVEVELDSMMNLRPDDVSLLVASWNERGQFTTWSSVFKDLVERSLDEPNELRGEDRALSRDERLAGLQRLGACTVLSKRPLVCPPGADPAPDATSGSALFSDWEDRQARELFQNGLLTQKGAAAVQLSEGALPNFLAAQWLASRFRAGWSLARLEAAVFVRVFGSGQPSLPMSRVGLAGWLSSEVPEFRSSLCARFPASLLFEGDPSRLRAEEIAEALRKYIESWDESRDLAPSKATLRQLARPELETTVQALLANHRGHEEILRWLLRLAELGGYRSMAALALEIAFDQAVAPSTRASAVAAVKALGSNDELNRLFELVSEAAPNVRSALFRALVPDQLKGDALVTFLLRPSDLYFQYYLERAVDSIELVDIDAALQGVMPRLTTSNIVEDTESDVALATILAASRLRRTMSAPVPEWVGDVLARIDDLADAVFVPHERLDSLNHILAQHVPARRALWEARLSSSNVSLHDATSPRLGPAQTDDLEWLVNKKASSTDQRVTMCLDWAISSLVQRMSTGERAERFAADAGAVILRELVEQVEQTDRSREEMEAASTRKKEREDADQLAKNQNALLPMKAGIERGNEVRALIWAWEHTQADTTRGRIDLGHLETLVGPDLTAAFCAGFKALWRRQSVPLPDPGVRSTPIRILAGLTGLTLEIRDGLELETLSDENVELAARYALYELNAFPFWFADLAQVRPKPVERVLRAVVSMEWAAQCEHHGVLRFAERDAVAVSAMFRGAVLDELNHGPPGHVQTLRYAADAFLTGGGNEPDVASLLFWALDKAPEADVESRAEWVRLLAHFDPIGTADRLDSALLTIAAPTKKVIELAAARLEHDFDGRGQAPVSRLREPKALERWILLLEQSLRPSEDIVRPTGVVYSPGSRDHAQEFRGRCLRMLAESPDLEAYAALHRLEGSPEMSAHADRINWARKQQLAIATEAAATAWKEQDFAEAERGDERKPRSQRDLYELVLRHLHRVAELVENDDFSYARLFKADTPEEDVQRWVASSLKLVSRGLYSVEREPEVQGKKEIDISVMADGVGRVPIEIKPLGDYSYNGLVQCIEDQLCGKYMRPPDVQYGLLLLVRLKEKQWDLEGKSVDFANLVVALRAHATAFGPARGKVIGVATIDMLR